MAGSAAILEQLLNYCLKYGIIGLLDVSKILI